MAEQQVGPGRVLVGFYVLFVVAAASRSGYQLGADPHRALLAYLLSAVAAVAYAVGLGFVWHVDRTGRGASAARAWCVLELAAVLAVGTWTLARPGSFPHPTVWSYYGVGYLLMPVALPLLVLWWLRQPAAAAKTG